MTSQKPKILLSEGSSCRSREAITALGLAGHRVELVSSTPMSLGRFSRFVSRVHRAPASGADPDGYLAAVIDIVKTENIDAVIPVHEQAYLFAAARKLLPAGVGMALADFAAFEQVQSKARLATLLTQLKVPQPDTEVVRSADDFAANGRIRFSSRRLRTASAGVWRVGDAHARDALLLELEAHDVFAQGLLVQAAVTGSLERTQGVFDRAASSPAISIARCGRTGRRRRAQDQHRQRRGSRHRRTHRTSAAVARRAVVRLHPDDATNTPHFIDANPRLVEPMNAWLSGVDLPGALCGSRSARRRRSNPTATRVSSPGLD